MRKTWLTQARDVHVARQLMELYAQEHKTNTLGLFEVVVHPTEKSMSLQPSEWIRILIEHFSKEYGPEQGEFITRHVVTNCIVGNETVH